MSDENISEELQRELETLSRDGLSLSEAIGGVLAPGGLDMPEVSSEAIGSQSPDWAQQTLLEMNRTFGISYDCESTSGSVSSNPSTTQGEDHSDSAPNNNGLPPLPPRSEVDRRHSVDNAALERRTASGPVQVFSRALNASRRRLAKDKKRPSQADLHFETVFEREGSTKRMYFKCIECGEKVYNKKKRNKVFHLIVCSALSEKVRGAFYYHCYDKEKPPLLQKTYFGMTPTMARRIAEELKEKRAAEDREDFLDPTRIPRFAQYLIAKHKLKPNTRIIDCSEKEQEVATNLLLELIVEENLPFAVCDNKGRHPRALGRLLAYLRPGFKLPFGYKVGGDLLDTFYDETVKDIKGRLHNMLQACRGTLMFDGSEDVNNAPMINILLRVMGPSPLDTLTFFLTTVYTGYDTVDAAYYVRMAESVIEEFVGFNGVAGVVTDNTGSVKNARETMERKHGRVVASQDQAHVADRLMTDIGEIPWVATILDTLSRISSDLRRFRKLRARLIELMKEYNATSNRTVTAQNEAVTNTNGVRGDNERSSSVIEEGFMLSDIVLPNYPSRRRGENDLENGCDAEDDENVRMLSSESQNRTVGSVSGSQPDIQATELPARKARLMKKVSEVRFASSESLLDEYKTLRPVLLKLIDDPLFDGLYTAKNERSRINRENSFVNPIRSENLFKEVEQLHAIFEACRTYLRVFDSETTFISEVFEATTILEEALKTLPDGLFPEPCKRNKQELLEVFANRKEGPFPGRKQIKIRLLDDLHIAAALLDPYRSPIKEDDYMDAFRRHLDRYLSGLVWEEIGIEERDQNEFVEEMLHVYANVRSIWRTKNLLIQRTESSIARSDARPSAASRKKRSPISWWVSGAITKPRDPFRRKAVEELIEFARRTLSVSPTATATERTFSLEGRIHPKNRSSLSPRKVSKILFCQWNAKVLHEIALRDETNEISELEAQTVHMRKLRQFRSAASIARDESKSLNESGSQDSSHQNVTAMQEHGVSGTQPGQPAGHHTVVTRNQSGPSAGHPVVVSQAQPIPRTAMNTEFRHMHPVMQRYPENPAAQQQVQPQGVVGSVPMLIPQPPPTFAVVGDTFPSWVQMFQTTMAAYSNPGTPVNSNSTSACPTALPQGVQIARQDVESVPQSNFVQMPPHLVASVNPASGRRSPNPDARRKRRRGDDS